MGTNQKKERVVREERLELSRVAPLEPKSSASTNSATLAYPPQHRSRNGKVRTAETNKGKSGVDEGVRTLDRRSHNPELYQLSYVHHIREVPYGTHLLTSTLLVRRVRCQPASSSMARPAGLEPATIRLEGGCSIQLSYGRLTVRPPEYSESGRGREIRTPDILLPKQARYQTALYPVN